MGNDEEDILLTNILSKHWYKKKENDLRILYNNEKPYNHGMIDNFCNPKFLENVLKELKENTKVKFKESDLFRVYQSIDLGNLTKESSKELPNIYKLKNILYSS